MSGESTGVSQATPAIPNKEPESTTQDSKIVHGRKFLCLTTQQWRSVAKVVAVTAIVFILSLASLYSLAGVIDNSVLGISSICGGSAALYTALSEYFSQTKCQECEAGGKSKNTPKTAVQQQPLVQQQQPSSQQQPLVQQQQQPSVQEECLGFFSKRDARKTLDGKQDAKGD